MNHLLSLKNISKLSWGDRWYHHVWTIFEMVLGKVTIRNYVRTLWRLVKFESAFKGVSESRWICHAEGTRCARQRGRRNKRFVAWLLLGSELTEGAKQLPAQIDACLETYTRENKLLTSGFHFLSRCLLPSLSADCFWKMSKLRARKPIFRNIVILGVCWQWTT